MSRGVKFRTLIPRAVALGADPLSFMPGGVNHFAATSRVDLGPEDAEQAVFMAVCRSRGVLAWANMNGSNLAKASRAKASVIGRVKGVPDVMVTWGIEGDDAHILCGIAIEFKRPSLRPKRANTDPMGKAGDEQREWLRQLRVAGWISALCFTADDAIAILRCEGAL